MSLPRAHVRHATRDRLRLGIPERRGEAAWFEEVAETLGEADYVHEVRVNALTGSVLLQLRDAGREDVAALARREGLFDVVPPRPPEPLLRALHRRIERADRGLQRVTDGQVDLNTVGFLLFLGGGLIQFFRGKYLPAGLPMIWSAKNLAAHAAGQLPAVDEEEDDEDGY